MSAKNVYITDENKTLPLHLHMYLIPKVQPCRLKN